MGSGAFLVEACRAIATRLVKAWERWPATHPVIPPDEDEELHARRLVAQRCLYGVDKNPRAVDLAKLSLWLATLAKDHEFTFLDHALKCGDSLVGLTPEQIAAANWDSSKPGLPLLRPLVAERVAEADRARAEIRSAPDDTMRAIQEQRHKHVETRLSPVRLLGDAVIAAFFSAHKAKAREKARADAESWFSGRPARWDLLEVSAKALRTGEYGVIPFHWAIEFPEVFKRENGGFDAIVGNPPFAGKNTIISGSAKNYLPWLQTLHDGAHGNADLVAHFFRRTFALLRQGGAFGLIATNTIGQGDTRATGLMHILADGGEVYRAQRRLRWPGDAAVVVSVVHVSRGKLLTPILNRSQVSRISAYLVEGSLDTSPKSLVENAGKAFEGSKLLGMGFTFDDSASQKGLSESISTMRALIEQDVRNAERILPYIGGEEINGSPTHEHRRFAIDFEDFPLRREPSFKSWFEWSDERITRGLREGVVPTDYPGAVAADWPELLRIVERHVKPQRAGDKREIYRRKWWIYAERRAALYPAISRLSTVWAISRVSPHLAFARLSSRAVFADSTDVFAFEDFASFSVLQSRAHELWARYFSSSMKDDLRYAPSHCFRTFPLAPALQWRYRHRHHPA